MKGLATPLYPRTSVATSDLTRFPFLCSRDDTDSAGDDDSAFESDNSVFLSDEPRSSDYQPGPSPHYTEDTGDVRQSSPSLYRCSVRTRENRLSICSLAGERKDNNAMHGLKTREKYNEISKYFEPESFDMMKNDDIQRKTQKGVVKRQIDDLEHTGLELDMDANKFPKESDSLSYLQKRSGYERTIINYYLSKCTSNACSNVCENYSEDSNRSNKIRFSKRLPEEKNNLSMPLWNDIEDNQGLDSIVCKSTIRMKNANVNKSSKKKSSKSSPKSSSPEIASKKKSSKSKSKSPQIEVQNELAEILTDIKPKDEQGKKKKDKKSKKDKKDKKDKQNDKHQVNPIPTTSEEDFTHVDQTERKKSNEEKVEIDYGLSSTFVSEEETGSKPDILDKNERKTSKEEMVGIEYGLTADFTNDTNGLSPNVQSDEETKDMDTKTNVKEKSKKKKKDKKSEPPSTSQSNLTAYDTTEGSRENVRTQSKNRNNRVSYGRAIFNCFFAFSLVFLNVKIYCALDNFICSAIKREFTESTAQVKDCWYKKLGIL